jgi:hypothetical protein
MVKGRDAWPDAADAHSEGAGMDGCGRREAGKTHDRVSGADLAGGNAQRGAFRAGGSVMAEKSSPMIPAYPNRPAGPAGDAWVTHFFHENHLDFETAPDKVASPEQVRFIVHLPENAVYYPCSREVFEAIARRESAEYLRPRYDEIWSLVERLVLDHIIDEG